MAEIKNQSDQLDLSEVLKQIESAGKHTYKKGSDELYCDLPVLKIYKWQQAIEDARSKEHLEAHTRSLLIKAKDDLAKLQRSAEARHTELSDLVKSKNQTEARLKEHTESQTSAINKLTLTLEERKKEIEEFLKARTETVKQIAELQAALKSPEGKFDPEAAADMAANRKDLQSDLVNMANLLAAAKAEFTAASKEKDKLCKEIAATRKEADDAKIALSSFQKEEKAKLNGVDELFDYDIVDVDKLALAFGKVGRDKLLAVLDIPPFDVRGRVGKLVGFCTVVGNKIDKKMAALNKLLQKALELFRSGATTWIAVLGPWINGILKDIVMFNVANIKVYRADLEARIAKVSQISAKATVTEKLAASEKAAADRPSWKEVMLARVALAKAQVKSHWASVKVLSFRVANYAKQGVGKTRHGLKAMWRNIKSGSARARDATLNWGALTLISAIEGFEKFYKWWNKPSKWSRKPDKGKGKAVHWEDGGDGDDSDSDTGTVIFDAENKSDSGPSEDPGIQMVDNEAGPSKSKK